jgi:uncharacterized GH25 family protein
MMMIMKRSVSLAIVFLCVQSLQAHDFWIEPTTFRPGSREAVAIRLMQGEHFRGEAVARNEKRIERFVVSDGSGQRPVDGTNGDEPAGRIQRTAPGLSIVGYRTHPLRHGSMAAPKFESYLREEGLERIIDLRAARGDAMRPGTERFSRSAKALILQPGNGGARFDEPLGLRFEIVPATDPHDAAQATLTAQLLFEGRPVEGALVTAIHRDDPAATRNARSNREGRVTLPIVKSGVWLIKSVHMIEAPEGSGVDWESIWATLTFERRSR